MAAMLMGPAEMLHAQEDSGLAEQAYQILKKRCYQCHGVSFKVAGFHILDREILTNARGEERLQYVTPGNPEESKLWKQIEYGAMPPTDELPEDEAETLKKWIEAGAEFPVVTADERPFISREQVLQTIYNYLGNIRKVQRADRQFQRFFTLTHLHNNRKVTRTELRLYRAALSKAINSLTDLEGRETDIVLPKPIDEEETVFAVDLRLLGWSDDAWNNVLAEYPYGLKPASLEGNSLHREIEEQYELFDGITHVRADWFIAKATRPPLYHELVGIPDTLSELEEKLGVERQDDFLNNRLVRAGVVRSGVSAQNRMLDRHPSRRGSFWISYDFIKNSGRGNLARFPLGPTFDDHPFEDAAFEHAGNEIIFTLPNGMLGFMLTTADGDRIDVGPIDIVWDANETSGTPQIVNGLSCMACHKHGMQIFEDSLREGHALINSDARRKVEDIFRWNEMKRRLDEGRNSFLTKLTAAVGPFLQHQEDTEKPIQAFPEPISAVARLYNKELGLNELATELGYEDPNELSSHLSNRGILRLGLTAVRTGGTIKRSMWEGREDVSTPFQEAANELNIGIGITINGGTDDSEASTDDSEESADDSEESSSDSEESSSDSEESSSDSEESSSDSEESSSDSEESSSESSDS
jgi:serine/threonine-protein kinase